MSTPAFAFDSPHDAIAKLLAGLVPVEARSVPLHDASGMVLSQPIVADRDSPPHDVSAMDGYAVRHDAIADLPTTLAVVGEAAIGQPPPPMPDQGCLKISTGACVPSGCDGVIPREQVEESDDFADNKTFYALSITSINELIPHISNVKTITELKVSHCDSLIKTDGISKLINLRILDLSFNQLEEFNHTGLNNLVSLNLSCN